MPLYDYKCEGCGKTHETLVSKVLDSVQCPDCGGVAVVQPAAFGGYAGSFGGASTRPKGAGSFNGRKKK